MLNYLKNEHGFTLLETMIAMAIMMVSFASILMVESASINTSEKSKIINIVAMLARNAMIKAEYDIEGKTFDEMEKEKTGKFDPPFDEYKWKREIKEVKFPDLGSGKAQNTGANNSADQAKADESAEMVTKLVTQFFTDATREITITVSWARGKGEQTYQVSTYWVNLNTDFRTSE